MNDLAAVFASKVGPISFRLAWWNHLDPTKRKDFAADLFEAVTVAAIKSYEDTKNEKIPRAAFGIVKAFCAESLQRLIGGRFSCAFEDLVSNFEDESFDMVVERVVEKRNESEFNRVMAAQYDLFLARTENLSHELISAVKTVNEEYVIWLKTHPDDLGEVAWQAFERLTAEILSSHGFEVRLTGRARGTSADVLAVENTEDGRRIRHMVECKRYKDKIGIGIVHQVIGAKEVRGIEHAMLVTTSSFTRDVIKQKPRLVELKLDLKDGNDVVNWLKEYEFHEALGLWLEPEWYS